VQTPVLPKINKQIKMDFEINIAGITEAPN
jgi:hypothetical protein